MIFSGRVIYDFMNALDNFFPFFSEISTMASAQISAAGCWWFLVGGFCVCSLGEKILSPTRP